MSQWKQNWLENSETASLKWWKKKKKNLSAKMSMSNENILQKLKWKKYIFKHKNAKRIFLHQTSTIKTQKQVLQT